MRFYYILAILLTILVLAVVAVAWFTAPAWRGYKVVGVPYAGWKASVGQELISTDIDYGSAIGLGSPASSLWMITAFWHLQDSSLLAIAPEKASSALPVGKEPRTLEDIAQIAGELGYQTKIIKASFGLLTLATQAVSREFGRQAIPVIVEQSLHSAYPGKGQIFRVVVGVSPGAKEVYVHDYIYGPQQPLLKEDFLALWGESGRILVIKPSRRVTVTGYSSFDFTNFPQLEESERRLLTIWYLAEEARRQADYNSAISFWEEIIGDKDFYTTFSQRIDKVNHYTALMSLYLRKKRYNQIVKLEKRVIDVNIDLNYDAPGNPQNHEAWVFLGEGFLGTGDKQKAAEYARRALAVYPADAQAKALLEKSIR